MGTNDLLINIDEGMRPFILFLAALDGLGLKSANAAAKQVIYKFDGKYHTKDEEGNFHQTILLG